jgi:hypothetical protein
MYSLSTSGSAPISIKTSEALNPLFLPVMAVMRMMTVMGMTRGVSRDHCAGKNHQRDGSENHTAKFHRQPLADTRPLHHDFNAIWPGFQPEVCAASVLFARTKLETGLRKTSVRANRRSFASHHPKAT